MYSITNTEGIILKSFDQGEKDVLVSVLTRDLGHIYARATGIRDIKSKNRFALQEYSISNLSLIHGKSGWKITNTAYLNSLYFEPKHSYQRETILKILAIVRRLYIGEDSNYKIFDDLKGSVNRILTLDSRKKVEEAAAYSLFNFLNDLGYIDHNVKYDPNNLSKMRNVVNNGIRESGL